jgi:hypothetical protein
MAYFGRTSSTEYDNNNNTSTAVGIIIRFTFSTSQDILFSVAQ